MKKTKTIMKILIMVSIVLILTLLVLIIFLFKKIQGLEDKDIKQNKVIKNHVIKKEYSINNIDGISFDFMNSKVFYHSYDEEKILIKQKGKTSSYLVNKNINSNKLYFSESTTSIFGKIEFNIYIPKKYLNTISIKNGFGNIKIDDFNNFLLIDNNAGNVFINNTFDINIKNVSGMVKVNNINGMLTLYSSTGDIFINELDGSSEMETITGNININNFKITNKSNIYTTSGDLSINIDNESDCLFKYTKNENYKITKKKCKKGKNIFSIKNVTGNVVIK